MPADPISAGRKGGSSRSEKKLAAARRNGFQKVKPESQPISKPENVNQKVEEICARNGATVSVSNPLPFSEEK